MRLLVIGLISLLAVGSAAALDSPGKPEHAPWFHYSGVEPGDVALPVPPGALPLAADVAAAPLTAHDRLLMLTRAWTSVGDGDRVRFAWTELGHAPAPTAATEPAGDLREQLLSRKDLARCRKLDPVLLGVLDQLVTLAGEIPDETLFASPRTDMVLALENEINEANTVGSPFAWTRDQESGEVARAALAEVERHPLADLADASERVWQTALAVESALAGVLVWPTVAVPIHTSRGTLWIGTPGADSYPDEYLAVLDPGGDDRHGSSHAPLNLVIDLAGNDTYRDAARGEARIAVVIDGDGDDRYGIDRPDEPSGGVAVGLGGCGVLLDRRGDDHYRGQNWSLAVGMLGVGLLVDLRGHDLYEIGTMGQGAAGPFGIGALVDEEGNDTYLARDHAGSAQGFGTGVGPGSAGGLGLLLDLGGDEWYGATQRSQGAGHQGGMGLLWDMFGDDRYQADRWSQGAAAHGAIGVLWDFIGDDRYTLGDRGQAHGHDRALGILFDTMGHDRYAADAAAQGYATANGVALFDDRHGDDAYQVLETSSWGRAEPLRGEPTVALFVDGEGADRYGPGEDPDRQVEPALRHGLRVDDDGPEAEFPAMPVDDDLPGETAELLAVSMAWTTHPGRAELAVAELAGRGPDLYPELVPALAPSTPARAAVVARVMDAMATRDPAWGVELQGLLVADLVAGVTDDSAALRLPRAAALPGDKLTYAVVEPYLTHEIPAVRKAAAAVAESCCAGETDEQALLLRLAEDDDPAVRAAAAGSLSRCGSADAVAPLVAALQSPHLSVRDNAAASLVALGRAGHQGDVLPATLPLVRDGSIPALEVLQRLPDPAATSILEELVEGPDPAVRGHAALALGAIGDHRARKALMGREAIEEDAFVRWCLARALRTPGNAAAINPELR